MWNPKQLIFLGLVILGLLIYFILNSPDSKRKFDWREIYKEESVEPYGSFLFKELLADYFPAQELTIIRDSIASNLPADGQGLFVSHGQSMYLTERDLDDLVEFVKAGGNALLACQYLSYDIMFYIYFTPCENYYWDGEFYDIRDSIVPMNFNHPDLRRAEKPFKFKYAERNELKEKSWNYFSSIYFCEQDSGLVALGTIEDEYTNFARVPLGKGYFYLHTNPLVFTNYNLKSPDGRDYLAGVLRHFPEGPIYWDEYSRQPEQLVRSLEGSGRGNNMGNDDRLRFILSNPPLAWAWYLLLGMALVYLLLNTKRRQRVVPVLEPNNNTTLEYLNTIGRMYFMHNDNKQLAKQQAKLWRQHLWQEYGLRPQDGGEQFAAILSQRSGRPLTLVEPLLGLYHSIDTARFISEETMVNFHQQLESFYHYNSHQDTITN